MILWRLPYLLALGLSPAFLGTALSAQAIPPCAGDDFDDNSKDLTRWGEDANVNNNPASQLSEVNGRLEFTGNSRVFRPWILGDARIDMDWEVAVDMAMGGIPLQAVGDFVQFDLIIGNRQDDASRSGFPGDRFSTFLQLYYSAVSGVVERLVQADYEVDWGRIEPSADAVTSSELVGLRIAFDSATRTLTAWYDPDGSGNGGQWTQLRSVQITDWQMGASSTFGLWLGVSVEGPTVVSGQDLFVDNLRLLGGWGAGALPFITRQPEDQTAEAGGTAQFSVQVSGTGPFSYTWQKDGEDLHLDGRITGSDGAILTITDVSRGDAGVYAVLVADSCGVAVSSGAMLNVENVPAEPPTLKIEWSEDRPQLKLWGTVGATYVIERAASLFPAQWRVIAEATLSTSPWVCLDETAGLEPEGYYRARSAGGEPGLVPEMVWIEPGTFTMGSPIDERGRSVVESPQTDVNISRGFWLGCYEVTQREYEALIGQNPSHFQGDLDRPVEQVSWYDAVNYCEALTQRERWSGRLPSGYAYGLPTEAQWEYACRAGTTTRFSFGDALGCYDFCGFCAEMKQYMVWCWPQTEPVGTRLPNPWGLYDMHGNVFEWCADWYGDGRYPGGSVTDPTGAGAGSIRVYRGGSWNYSAEVCRSAARGGDVPSRSVSFLGFRVALVPVL
ncbi:MAG: SUMF1/EgtB/PvdO family nonheme iron enzyme [Verrucomicrobiales bacterium]|nr:SUMF1/EgtB/PvdO family nonheme iron enzyme [Verrucomicrobiales bacterium]